MKSACALPPAVFDWRRHVQLERIDSGRVAKSALAGLLAFFVLVASTASVSHELHKALHSNATTASHYCLVCSLAKGQVAAADVAPLLALFTLVLLFSIPTLKTLVLPVSDRRLAHGRAPPVR
jgi:hypothetical protein